MIQQIKVSLPLPSRVASRLLSAVGAVWPDAKLRLDDHHERFMLIEVDDPDGADDSVAAALERLAASEDEQVERIIPPSVDDVDMTLTSMRDGTFGMAPPEWYARMMYEALHLVVGDAPNYVETSLHGDDGQFTTIVVRPNGKTPHQLREQAETERDAARAAEQLRRGHWEDEHFHIEWGTYVTDNPLPWEQEAS